MAKQRQQNSDGLGGETRDSVLLYWQPKEPATLVGIYRGAKVGQVAGKEITEHLFGNVILAAGRGEAGSEAERFAEKACSAQSLTGRLSATDDGKIVMLRFLGFGAAVPGRNAPRIFDVRVGLDKNAVKTWAEQLTFLDADDDLPF